MLSVGDADSILVTHWYGSTAERILIDGGNAKDAGTVREFLRTRGVHRIEDLVCSHLHDDHAAGLVGLAGDPTLTIGTAWVHRPELHVDVQAARKLLMEMYTSPEAQAVLESLRTASDLVTILQRRGIPICEPFAGARIGSLSVLGPSEAYYEELVAQFVDVDQIRKRDDSRNSDAQRALTEKQLGDASDVLFDDPQTSPENNSSTILAAQAGGGLYLLTADAGVDALQQVIAEVDLSGCHWVQLPHHGSRRNITRALIDYFRPAVGFASASGKDGKHPRRAVVNAFKKAGTQVYSTHYPISSHKWQHWGNVPSRPDYTAATALYDRD